MATLHRSAAEGFEAGAPAYAAGRPGYPGALDGWLSDALGLGPGKTALDLGAGTGKFTPRLVATGARVTAVEPVAAMRAEFRRANPDIDIAEGRAEAIPAADASVDAVVCAQSFHWFATPAALAEIRRVLKVGGALGLVWNVRDLRVGWVAALDEIMRPYESDAPRHESGAWRNAFPAPGFSALDERRFAHAHEGPPERVIVDRVLSVSFIAALDAAERAKVEDAVRGLIAAAPDLSGRDRVAFPYETVAARSLRLS
ncbi:methyltransferase family protein [Roseiarcus fermentans]|uniref:Methyltransferase family protein n=1 Tax=Roseiarcus fermentans TaxID=1473586 RepID=A0A366ELI0_9HYPH|nr:class I SAM-dependent methyltransferase [Roseiarcus fermentans]RBP02319.1 methyltransferase family protein [Roseiarcus fermentans]